MTTTLSGNYTGEVDFPSSFVLGGSVIPGKVNISNVPTQCNFTVVFPTSVPITGGRATLTAGITAVNLLPQTIFQANATIWEGTQSTVLAVQSLELSTTSNSTTSSTISGLVSSLPSQVTSASDTVPSTLPSPTSSTQPRQTGYGVGELVGAAVGCFLGGAILAALAACLFMRRKPRKRNVLSGVGKEMSALHDHDGAIYEAGSKSWKSHVPQSESDGTIRSMANRTLDQIEMYVENFYKDTANVQLSPAVQSKVVLLGSGHLPSPILSLLSQSTRPTVLIKHCIANLVFSRIAAGENSGASFLPRDFTSLQPSSTAQRKPGFTQALSTWRILTVYLRTETEHDLAYQSERDRVIADAAQQVCEAFRPWARSTDDTRFQSLVSIMKRASDLGIMLFSQPSTFQWQWHAQNRSGPLRNDAMEIVVLPGLDKTTDEDARPLSPPMGLVEPRLGGMT